MKRPLAATCGHSSGCEWLRVAANGRRGWLHLAARPLSVKRPLAATRVAASGCEWLRMATGVGCTWLQEAVVGEVATCGHLRPLAGSGHLRPLAATRWERPLAATCGHSLGAATCGHLRPLAATRWERPLAATCGHSLGTGWSGHEWLRVAAGGCVLVEIRGGVGILKKIGFAGKAFLFKFGGWIGRILSCLTKPRG